MADLHALLLAAESCLDNQDHQGVLLVIAKFEAAMPEAAPTADVIAELRVDLARLQRKALASAAGVAQAKDELVAIVRAAHQLDSYDKNGLRQSHDMRMGAGRRF